MDIKEKDDNITEQQYLELAEESKLKFDELNYKIKKLATKNIEANKMVMSLYSIFKLLDINISSFEITSIDNDITDSYLEMLVSDGRSISSNYLDENLFG